MRRRQESRTEDDAVPDDGAPSPRLLQDAAATFGMLAATTRLHIVWLLARAEQDVTALAEATGGNVAAVSQHLAKLKLAGLVSSRREGRRQVYVVDDPHVVAIVRQMLDHHAEQAEQAFPVIGRPANTA
ncbi:ArsR/SmtB family transcription factor [Catenulispora pinisilvae]|uniref:ArsR/SmtB family transcription factor n=1 Tax=Catenulispora pinisilvae TaxID=2705253 RepID=UPI001891BFF0|nr:metalloregulator ArsR/SmtB family transcription factor [Catenulispora pinisilvae]